MKTEPTEAELKFAAQLEAMSEAWHNGTLKTYTRAEHNEFSKKLIAELHAKYDHRQKTPDEIELELRVAV